MNRTIWSEEVQESVPPAQRGYSPSVELAEFVRKANRTSLMLSVFAIAIDHIMLFLAGLASYASLTSGNIWLAVSVPLLGWLVAARAARGLECIVHEASHFNLTRRRWLNDIVADVLCAWPVLSQVANYRKSHMVHHRAFGHPTDPDRIRHEKLTLGSLSRRNPISFTLGVLKRLVPYIPGWWWAIGVDLSTVRRFIAWHAIIFLIPASYILGFRESCALWIVMWGVPIFFMLPLLRFVAEAAEHDYELGRAETQVIFNRTWSNLGWIHRWFFHPHNDGFHVVHHLYPYVPHHLLPSVYAFIMANDSTFAERALVRTRLVDGNKGK